MFIIYLIVSFIIFLPYISLNAIVRKHDKNIQNNSDAIQELKKKKKN